VKIRLPNGKQHVLKDDITLEEKVKVVEELTEQWKSEIENGWDSNAVKFFLDSLSNYLVWHKDDEDANKEDKEVMSRNKTNRLYRGRKDTPFSSLSKKDKSNLFGEVRGGE